MLSATLIILARFRRNSILLAAMTSASACAHSARPSTTLRSAVAIPLPQYLDSLDVHRVVWAHRGAWLAFTATYNKQIDLYVVRNDGTGLRRLTDGATRSFRVGQLNLSWMPDDQGIFFLGIRDDTLRLFRINVDGSGLAEYPSPSIASGEGDISPDGSRIVFTSRAGPRNTQLYIRNVDGTSVRRLTTKIAAIQVDENPSWSPDGHTILFDSIRDTTGLGAIYRIDADGSHERALTTRDVNNTAPRWSPDGHSILWGQIANRRSFLMTADADGNSIRKLADDVGAGTFSPDGARIAANSRGEDRNHWFVVTLRSDGSALQRMTLRLGDDLH